MNDTTPLFIVRTSANQWHLCGPDGAPLMIGDEGCTSTTRSAAIAEARHRCSTDPGYTYPARQITSDTMFDWQDQARARNN